LRALAGFLPAECNFGDSIRIDGQRIKNNETFNSMLLPKNAAESFPPNKTIGAFALDLCGKTKKEIESKAAMYGMEKHILYNKPSKISPLNLQKISLWLVSLKASAAIFVEEPEGGFFDECRPFDFFQGLLRNGITGCIVYLANEKELILQKARAMQFCRARVAVFCADRLVEEGEFARIMEKPVHFYTKEWLKFGSFGQRKKGALWQYCLPDCKEQQNCPAKQSTSYDLWDCESASLHKVICKGFLS
jgi:hypothetical protein